MSAVSALPEEMAALGLSEAKVLRLEPGDTIVLMSHKYLSDVEVDEIEERVCKLFPEQRVAILEAGMTMGVLRQGGESK